MEHIISNTLVLLDSKLINYSITEQTIDRTEIITNNIRSRMSDQEANLKLSKKRCTLRDLCKQPILLGSTSKDLLMTSLLDYSFISFTIMSWIERCTNKIYTIKFKKVMIKIFLDTNDNIENIPKIIRNVVLLIEWILHVINKQNIIINVNIFMSPFKKEINNKILGFNEINSGMSNSGSCNQHHNCSDGFLSIFRKEELYKVLLHELIHNTNSDIKYFNFTPFIKHINQHKSSQKILVNEAYTELLALYFHSVFYSYINKLSLLNVLREEKRFTEIQINKIFNIMDVSSIEYFKKPNDFIQYTNVIPYYIIKYLFMHKMKQFINLFQDKEKTIKYVIKVLQLFYLLKIPKINISSDDRTLKMIKYNIL